MIDLSAMRCTEEQWQQNKQNTDEAAKRVRKLVELTAWREDSPGPNSPLYGLRHYRKPDGQSVCLTVGIHDDGKRWPHVSLTHPRRIPLYEELMTVKDVFIGRDLQAIQVHPPRSRHVNIHPHCLHMWACLDGDGLPDFGKAGSI